MLESTLTPELFFTPHWTLIGWGLSFVLMILLLTRLWKYVIEISLITCVVGWMCCFYAGFTGNWFIGWFSWVIYLSAALVIRGMLIYLEGFSKDGE